MRISLDTRMGISTLNGHIWVLEVGHNGPFLPKYAPETVKDWGKRHFTVPSKMSMEQQLL